MGSVEIIFGDFVQTTIQNSFSHVGVGVHLGRPVRVTVKPAPKNHGFVFKRLDVEENKSLIPGNYRYLSSGDLCTSLENSGGTKVMTVEHLLAALGGVGITNALIELEYLNKSILLYLFLYY